MGFGDDLDRCDVCSCRLDRKQGDHRILCADCANAVSKFIDDTGMPQVHEGRLIRFVTSILKRAEGCRFVRVATYYGQGYENAVVDGLLPEFGTPLVPISLEKVEGLRLVLGFSKPIADAPDISIERRPNGWALFLHPEPGGDASGFVYFIDDGRSFVVPEHGVTPPIEMTEWDRVIPILDRKKRI